MSQRVLVLSTCLLIAFWAPLSRWGQGEEAAFPAWDGKDDITSYAKRVGLSPSKALDLGNGVQLELVLIPVGSFHMGAAEDEEKKIETLDTAPEKPQHKVTFARPFYMGKYEVTQAQWLAVVGKAPKFRLVLEAEKEPQKYGSHPVEDVTLKECQEFCARVSAKAKGVLRLPSEAEWEYACRAGTTSFFYFGNEHQRKVRENLFETVLSNYCRLDAKGPYPVGQKRPNAWGLYDLYGNVYERVADPDHPNYRGATADGSAWLEGGDNSMTVVRGGSWEDSGPHSCRSAARNRAVSVNYHGNDVGFRVVMEVTGDK